MFATVSTLLCHNNLLGNMRRSKSNPAKYARNYRSISQRRMTEYDNLDEEEEIKRLREIIRVSETHLDTARVDCDDVTKKRKRAIQSVKEDDEVISESILSEEMKEEMECTYGEGKEVLVLMPTKKKRTIKAIELTPQEIRQAKQNQKNASRKLNQLNTRAEQKIRRAELYSKLEQNAISSGETALLASSSTLGKRETKREALKRLLSRERAGIPLSETERRILYSEKEIDETDQLVNEALVGPGPQHAKMFVKVDQEQYEEKEIGAKKGNEEDEKNHQNTKDSSETEALPEFTIQDEKTMSDDPFKSSDSFNVDETATVELSFAEEMMASLNNLKEKTNQQNKTKEEDTSELERIANTEAERKKTIERYIPTEPAILMSAAAMGLTPLDNPMTASALAVQLITRPTAVQESRIKLPVCSMEFEIVDSIRSNDVTILCSETGSGKSTQVPQFLYENGFTVPRSSTEQPLLIGITQPRRVAAVSTAKRVCYEMGQGDGQVIVGKEKKGNLVAYQTRYETAGLGANTRVKFMTDGILLQEIQTDLLLRKYGVIVLDEAHERNLNTDVLIGLLSVAIPLRRKASTEAGSTMKPLKLIIMSATLRVEDFTGNRKLFPDSTPVVIKVPGRTHPVTVHHSKITELDDYEIVACRKICQIHRKLPKGGILVFLTGKQEIVRMVNRLRKSLSLKSNKKFFDDGNDIITGKETSALQSGAPRDMDDHEIDGDIFTDERVDDFRIMDSENDDESNDEIHTQLADDGTEVPSHAIVLPLYSMMSVDEQAKVFAPVEEGQRLIVVATNIAETSITIPEIAYVVDTGRHKCRNYHAGTGVASYDVMWISKAAADQRAGRAGRTGPGHCYRLYSSSMYSRHMERFALPEVLTRPLEDVVLAMKAMAVSSVSLFPFPTPPDQTQLNASIQLLANLGCIDLSGIEENGGDGIVTRLGHAVAKLPLGVRYGKMLLIAAQAGVLDYAIAMVALLSENSPFSIGQEVLPTDPQDDLPTLSDSDDETAGKKPKFQRWTHRGGDILAGMIAVGAYTYAGRGAGGSSEILACKKFCAENGLNYPIMCRIQKMRLHLAKLAKTRFSNVEGVAARTGGIVSSMIPPNKFQESLLCQAIASGLLDNVAMLAPPGSFSGDHPFGYRSAYLSCSTSMKDPLYLDPKSALYSRDWRRLPRWICYDMVIRKSTKDGVAVFTMSNITPIDPSWLGALTKGSHLLRLGDPINTPPPTYDADKDVILCSVVTKFGKRGWEIPSIQVEMFGAIQKGGRQSTHFLVDDSFRWFARFLMEGKVIPELKKLVEFLNDDPSIITRKTPVSKVALLVSALSSAGIDSAGALRKHWSEVDHSFLFKNVQTWIKSEKLGEVKPLWMVAVKDNIKLWRESRTTLDTTVRQPAEK